MSMWTPPRPEEVWRVMRARLYAYTNFWRNGDSLTTFTLSLPANYKKIKKKSLQAKLILHLWARGKIVLIGISLSFRGLTARMTLNCWRKSQGSSERYAIIVRESLELYGMNTTKLSIWKSSKAQRMVTASLFIIFPKTSTMSWPYVQAVSFKAVFLQS